jgi:ryanodine receptor 2
MKPKYKPQPIDTSNIELSPDLLHLTEQIAENVHEVWAAQRISDGWQYGAENNDAQKCIPALFHTPNFSKAKRSMTAKRRWKR